MIQIGKPVNGSVLAPPTAPVALSTPAAARTCPRCLLTTGFPNVVVAAGVFEVDGELAGDVGVLTTVSVGPCPGSPGLPGSGVGFGFGVGDGGFEPQAPPRFPFSACTSTSCPPEQGTAL
jgi:hypothetical protein